MTIAGVRLVTLNASFTVLNKLEKSHFPKNSCIEIMDNLFIGYNCMIFLNVRIGSDVIIKGLSTVTKEIESGDVYAG